MKLKVPSDPANLREIRRAIERISHESGFHEQAVGEIVLCVNEAVSNVMRHAYAGARDRPIEIRAEFVEPNLRIEVRDWGRAVDSGTAFASRYIPGQPGGLGLECMRRCMDEVRYLPQAVGTVLRLSKRRDAPVPPRRKQKERHE